MNCFSSCFKSQTQTDEASYQHMKHSPGELRFGHELLIKTGAADGDEYINLLLHDDDVKDGCLTIVKRRSGVFHKTARSLNIEHASSTSSRQIPYTQILSAVVTTEGTIRSITIKAIYSNRPGQKYKLWTLKGQIEDHSVRPEAKSTGTSAALESTATTQSTSEVFCSELMKRAYGDHEPRRLRVIVNPHGGKGQAKKIYEQQVRPVFEAAGCQVDVVYTGPPGSETDATVLAKTHDFTLYDALVPISGDGISHQLFNGLASRVDARKALFSSPISPIPAGSGNALSINISGIEKKNDPVWSALIAVKGRETKMDLCSFVQGGKRTISFLTQALGLMADLDLETEHLRFIGDTRFTIGYIQGCLARRSYPFEISLKISGTTDKQLMAQNYNEDLKRPVATDFDAKDDGNAGLPALRFGTELEALPAQASERIHEDLPQILEEGWHTLRSKCLWAYGGKLPWIAADVKLFVTSSPSDGLIDLAIVPPLSPIKALGAIDGATTGALFFSPELRYYKAEVYRCKMLKPKGNIAVDGEEAPYTTYQVEVHRGLGRVLTLNETFDGRDELVDPSA